MTRNPAGRRLWRTADGGLVFDSDPAAVTLAYGPNDEVSADDLPLAEAIEPEPVEEEAVEPEPVQEEPVEEEAPAEPKKRAGRHAAKPEE